MPALQSPETRNVKKILGIDKVNFSPGYLDAMLEVGDLHFRVETFKRGV
jgi:hypothetical protein